MFKEILAFQSNNLYLASMTTDLRLVVVAHFQGGMHVEELGFVLSNYTLSVETAGRALFVVLCIGRSKPFFV